MKKIYYCIGLIFISLINLVNSYGGVFIIQNDYPELKLCIHFENTEILSISPSIHLITGEKGLGNFEDVFLHYAPADDKDCADIALFPNDKCGKSYRLNIKNLFGQENQMIGQPIDFNFGTDVLRIVIEKVVFPCTKGEIPLIKNSNMGTFHAVISKATLNGVELSKNPRDTELSLRNIYGKNEPQLDYTVKDIL